MNALDPTEHQRRAFTSTLIFASTLIALRYHMKYYALVASVDKIVARMRTNARGIAFSDLAKVCDHYFGKARTRGGSHAVYKTPWRGDPRVNIQDDHGKAKAYQVRQVLKAIDKLEGSR